MTAEVYYQRVLKITAEDSPNVQYARWEIEQGKEPSDKVVVPGVLTWGEYQHRRKTWHAVRQKIGLDAEFPEDQSILLYPDAWLKRAKEIARQLKTNRLPRYAKSIGIDPAEGGDKTAMCAGDERGVIELVSRKTPDTSQITDEAIAFGKKHGVPPERWFFDRGGGGKQHADRLRRWDYNVQTVAFGEAVRPEVKRAQRMMEGFKQRLDQREDAYVYTDRRSQLAWLLRERLDPSLNEEGFGIPEEYDGTWDMGEMDLFNQMAPIPITLDEEGRFDLLPKHKAHRKKKDESDEEGTLVGLIGHSPDELDALMLMNYGLTYKVVQATAGVG